MHLAGLREAMDSQAAHGSDTAQEGSAEEGGTAPASGHSGEAAGGAVAGVPTAAEAVHPWVASLESWPGLDMAGAASMSRVLARRGAAYAHMKCFVESAADYGSAACLAGLAGDGPRQQQLEADAERLRGLAPAEGL